MKKITVFAIVSLLVIMPLLIAGMAAAESYATPLPGSVATATEERKIDLTPFFQAVIALLAAIVTRMLIPWIKSRTTEKEQANLSAAVRIAVFAAEQIYGAGNGEEKLAYAIGKLRAWGFDLDSELLKAAVESAVYGLNNPTAAVHTLTEGAPVCALPEEDGVEDIGLPPLDDWPLEMIVNFCIMNKIPHDGCVTKDDYINAIVEGVAKEAYIDADTANTRKAKSTEPPDVEAPVSVNE